MALGLLVWSQLPEIDVWVIGTFIGAYFLFVVLDIVSGRALTTYDNIPKTVVVLALAVVALGLVNLAYRRLGSR